MGWESLASAHHPHILPLKLISPDAEGGKERESGKWNREEGTIVKYSNTSAMSVSYT